MNRLASYIIVSVLKGTALVVFALVAVSSVIEFVGQLEDVGLAAYGLREAVIYVALRIPHKMFDVLPAAALLGALLSLGNMAVHRELIVMRASGISQYRLVGAVGAAGVVLLVVMLLLGESLAPSLGAYARELRADALRQDIDIASGQSTWLKDGERIINLRRPGNGIEFEQRLTLFDLDGDTALDQVVRADLLMAESATGEWEMRDYAETRFDSSGTAAVRQPTMQRDYGLSLELLGLGEFREDLLDTPTLRRYISYLEAQGLDASRYLAAYWGRIASGASVVFMTVLALPFVLGGLRSAGAGARMIIGLVIGLGYFVLVQVSANIGTVFRLDPVLAAWAPSALLLVVTAIAVVRLR
ncbi:MAG: LPS export ABC transporter permease LptG [Gammaproteobacteria bacterium]|nr:LPS export ABC transporter permease LptG [Gammaproteobacteria bacterium]